MSRGVQMERRAYLKFTAVASRLVPASMSRLRLGILSVAYFAATPAVVFSQTLEAPLAQRGGISVSLEDIDALLIRVPEGSRAGVVSSYDRIQRLLDTALLNRQMAAIAQKNGVAADPAIQRQVQIATEEVLARAVLDKHLSGSKQPDFSILARERFLASPGDFTEPNQWRVQHILINTKDRTIGEAKAIAEKLLAQARSGADFEKLVQEHSEDPGKDSNSGIYVVSVPGQFVPAFEAAARELTKAGEISEPVPTDFGVHIIKLLGYTAAIKPTFEQAKTAALEKVTAEYETRVRGDFISDLRSAEPKFNEELIAKLRVRYGEGALMTPEQLEKAGTGQ